MIVKDGARDLLNKMLEDDNKNSVLFFVQGGGCHTQVMMDLVDAPNAMNINGLNVVMDPQTQAILDQWELDVNDFGLVIRNLGASGCGGCGGGCGDDCGGGCGDSGCCCE